MLLIYIRSLPIKKAKALLYIFKIYPLPPSVFSAVGIPHSVS